MKLLFVGIFLLCGLGGAAQNSNGTLLVYDYEKLDFVAYGVEVFMRTTNGTDKDVAFEYGGSSASHFNKRQVEELIKALDAILSVNPIKTNKGKRTGIYVLPDGFTSVYISENNEGFISFRDNKSLSVSPAALKKLLEVLKVAVSKL